MRLSSIQAIIPLGGGHKARADVRPDDAEVAISAVTASELLVGVELADDEYRDRRGQLVEGLIERSRDHRV
jgi:predicted nucleic acid-binding protein